MGEAVLMFWYAETALHAGGSDSVGVVDLPIQRETTTRLPTVWGQSAKGALRDHARSGTQPWPDVDDVFGSAPPGSRGAGSGPPKPGWLAVGDVRLIAFPVPTLSRTFAWVTSPLLLARLTRMARLAGITGLPPVPNVIAGQVLTTSADWGQPEARLAVGEHVLEIGDGAGSVLPWARWLAGNTLPSPPGGETADPFTFFRSKIENDVFVVADDDLTTITEEHVELLPRVQLEADSKTVRHGPWYTEFLPAETLMCSLLRDCLPPKKDAAGNVTSRLDGLGERLDGELLVAGGDESLGKGLLWIRLLAAEGTAGQDDGPGQGAGAGRDDAVGQRRDVA